MSFSHFVSDIASKARTFLGMGIPAPGRGNGSAVFLPGFTPGSQHLLEDIVGQMPYAITLIDKNGKFLIFNSMATELTGMTKEDIYPVNWVTRFGLTRPDDGQPYRLEDLPLAKALKGESTYGQEILIKNHPRPTGVLISCDARPLRDEKGVITGAFAIFHDITARREAETEALLRASALIEHLNDAVISLSLEGKVETWNPSAEKLFGYSGEEVYGRSLTFLLPEERQFAVRALLEGIRRGARPEGHETLIRRRDGRLVDSWLTLSPIKDRVGQIIGLSAVAHDISDQKRFERQLEFHAQMLSQVSDAIVATDLNHRITYWSRAAEVLMGYAADEVIGRNKYEIFQLDCVTRRKGAPLTPGVGWKAETMLRKKAGEQIYVEVSINSLRGDGGKEIGHLLVLHDLSDRKAAEDLLKLNAEELKRSNQELTQFAYVASHDLKEPLRMVTNFLKLLERRYKGQLDSDADDYIRFAVDGAVRMYGLIDDLLVYSRVGTRGEPFRLADCDDVLDAALSNLHLSVEESGVQIIREPLPTLNIDRSQLVQVFQNLISNAIKFRQADRPMVTIRAERIGDVWEFSVTDNGIGIESRFTDRIFVLFQRLHSREDYPGTGIGLAICKKIIERHGGRIWVASTPGRGSTFSFTLPAEAASSDYSEMAATSAQTRRMGTSSLRSPAP